MKCYRFSFVLLGILMSSAIISPAIAVQSSPEVYSQLHAAEGRVVAAESALKDATLNLTITSKALQDATLSEANKLTTYGDSSNSIGNAARDMYINGNTVEITLAVDFIKNGPKSLLDDADYKYILAHKSQKDIPKALLYKASTDVANSQTTQALANYNDANVKLGNAQQEDYASRIAFLNLAKANNVDYKGSQATSFSDISGVLPGATTAVARSLSYVDQPGLACSDGLCYQLCDHLAGEAWGYANSGYQTAREHWTVMSATGHAHPNDTHPPVGALLFWDTGLNGHVALYVGNGMIVTNMIGSHGIGVYEIKASDISQYWRAPYWGWSDPIFTGQLESK